MSDFFYSIDKWLFVLINQTLANPVFDVMMPPLTDWNKSWIGLSLFGLLWIVLVVKGGSKGRTIGILLIPLILMSDQLSSNVFKMIVERPRPCHEINGVSMVEHVRMLVPCGSGYSFPSSHAVNNFAFAGFLSFYYRRWSWILFLYAFLMGLSRIVVGVHYPSDVVAGALFGILCAAIFIFIWGRLSMMVPSLALTHETSISETPPRREPHSS